MNRIGRRAILRSILGVVLLPLLRSRRSGSTQAASLLVEQLRRPPQERQGATRKAFYRADVTILLLSLPIYRRRGAGGGCVEVEQRRDADRDSLAIRFSAGSYPEQARGLNRLGYIEEVIISRASQVEELAYFGFLTSSREKDVAEARRALEESGQTAVTYSAAEGHIRSGAETSRKSSLNLPDVHTWTQTGPLLEQVRTAFLADTEAETHTRKHQGAPATFLFSLLSAAWGRESTFEASYSYLAKDYHMRVEKKADLETGRRMAQDGLTHLPDAVVLLNLTYARPRAGVEDLDAL
ncbi:MAG: hypothetical protein WD733_06990, partial [Bryobacterales bacterium]